MIAPARYLRPAGKGVCCQSFVCFIAWTVLWEQSPVFHRVAQGHSTGHLQKLLRCVVSQNFLDTLMTEPQLSSLLETAYMCSVKSLNLCLYRCKWQFRKWYDLPKIIVYKSQKARDGSTHLYSQYSGGRTGRFLWGEPGLHSGTV